MRSIHDRAKGWSMGVCLALASAGLVALPSCSRDHGGSDTGDSTRVASSASLSHGAGGLRPAGVQEILAEVRRPGARATLVNVWASWCVPCREEFPDLLRLEQAYRDRGLRLMLVSTDFDSADATKFLVQQRVVFPTYFKTGDDMSFINGLNPKWSGALPATFVYDSTGRRVDFWEGRADFTRFERSALDAMQGAATLKENG